MVPKRLAARLILSLTVIVVIAEGVFGYINVKTQERQLLAGMVLGADQLSRAIASATWHSMLADQRAAAYEVMQTISLQQGMDRIRIFNKEGRITFSTASEAGRQVDKRAEACFLCHSEATPLVRVDVPSRSRVFRGPDGLRRLAIVTPIYNESACSTAACHAHPSNMHVLGVLDVSLRLDVVDAEVAGLRLRAFLVAVIEIALIGGFIVVFSRRFVGTPIRRLTEATQRVSQMNLDQPVTTKVGGEMAALAKSFDIMRLRLKDALEELNTLNRTLEARVDERTRQLKSAQERLAQSDRLASLGRLSATVAHEINNPLSGVLNVGMLLQRILKDDGIPPERVEEVRTYLSQIVRETERIARIVSDLLSFSRQAKPHTSPTDLNGVVRAAVAIVEHKLDPAEVACALALQEDLPAVLGDPAQLQQVVINLVMNAAEAMPGGGRIMVSTSLDYASPRVALEVRDEGQGIPEAAMPHLFEPFFTTKDDGKGTGLGLAVAYGIVQTHGGEIEVKTREDEGTTFRVLLALAPLRGESKEASS